MRVRVAKKSDKEEVLKFCTNTFEWGDYIDQVWDVWSADAHGKLYFVRSKNNNLPVAISHGTVCPGIRQIWVEGIRVHPAHRRKKIATALGVSDGWLLSGIGFMSLEEIDKFKSQRSDFPTLQMISTEDLSSAYKHFEQEISKHSGSLKSIYLEFARRINSELVYRTRTWEHKEKPPD